MFVSTSRFVLALLAVSSFGNFLVFVDGRCKIEPVNGHVNWPSNKKKIKKNAFKNCKELVTICIPPEVESIHNQAFVKSGLDLTKLYEVPCEADPAPLFSFKDTIHVPSVTQAVSYGVLVDPPIDYILSFTIKPKGIISGSSGSIIRVEGGNNPRGNIPSVFFSYETTELYITFAYDGSISDDHIISDALDIDTEYEVAVGVLGMTSTVSVNGVVKSTKSIGTRQQFDRAIFYIGGSEVYTAANALISNIRYDKQVPSAP